VLAAGPVAARPVVEPVFAAGGRATRWLADDATGLAASRLKLVINSWVVSVTAAIGEAVALADGLDVDPQAFLDAVADGPLDMPYLRAKASTIVKRDWSTNFSVANAAKDADLIVTAGHAAGLALDVVAAAGARYRRAETAGCGDADLTASYLVSFDPTADL
jgi:3-hydroxyisobutyrate dehydrogenase